ncbi:hypothetical protein GCM10010310_31640 [Streptomyces violaceolatus]|uniref:Uncharacterized protein n=1 Tax=Streptomyces violaceolatus TaxID=67378 RepID=A0ABN3SPD4_9ACTN
MTCSPAERSVGWSSRTGSAGSGPSDLADEIRLRHDADEAADAVHHRDGGDVVMGQCLGDRLEGCVRSDVDDGPGHEITYSPVLHDEPPLGGEPPWSADATAVRTSSLSTCRSEPP